ncbi:MocR-like pyridoxine biosynthesis transcription factor PdxR [Streptomyces sp. NPDC002285]
MESLVTAGIALPLRRDGDENLTEAMITLLADAINSGRLAPGTRLPSSRVLAEAVGVSRNVVLATYTVLNERGLTVGRHGSGSYVSAKAPVRRARPVPHNAPWMDRLTPQPERHTHPEQVLDMRLRTRPAAALPAAVWRRAWQAAAQRRLPAGYGDPAGDRRLRAALTDYLVAGRAVTAAPADVVVTSGAAEALGLVMRAALRPGDRVAVENPGYPAVTRMTRDRGADVVPVAVDADGIRVDLVQRLDPAPRILLLTPAHQFPTTAPLSMQRREQLLVWAQDNGVLLIEDDYGGEFATAPVPTLAAMDSHGVVAYVSTLSRLLAPSLRIGCLVAPRPLAAAVTELRGQIDSYLSLPVQQAVAELLVTGEITRQLRRARRLVAAQRAALSEIARPHLLHGLNGGLHVLIGTKDVPAEMRCAGLLLRDGILVDRLSTYYQGTPVAGGLLLDYAGMEATALARVAAHLNALPLQVQDTPT